MIKIVKRNLDAFDIGEVTTMLNNEFDIYMESIQYGNTIYFIGHKDEEQDELEERDD